MNRQRLSTMHYVQVRVRPIARRVLDGVELEPEDDRWMIENPTHSREKFLLRNTRTSHTLELGLDHVREYITDPRSGGFLHLKSQIVLRRDGVFVEPLF